MPNPMRANPIRRADRTFAFIPLTQGMPSGKLHGNGRKSMLSIMGNKLRAFLFACVCLFLLSIPAFAHHGGAAYDGDHPLTLTGTVKDFHFIQPHPLIALEVKDAQGAITEWSVEMTAPNHLSHFGWNGKRLKPGDEITVTGQPAKNGLKVLNLRKISYTNGEVIPLGPPPEPGQ
jgi:hypothetical protein